MTSLAKRQSGSPRSGTRNIGAAAKTADLDVVEPSAGAGSGITIAKLPTELHPKPAEAVATLVSVDYQAHAPSSVVRQDLHDGPVSYIPRARWFAPHGAKIDHRPLNYPGLSDEDRLGSKHGERNGEIISVAADLRGG